MTAEQEKKIDLLHDMLYTMQGDLKVYGEKQKQQYHAVLGLAKNIEYEGNRVNKLEANWNKLVGVTWIGTIATAILGVFAGVIAFLKHI